MSMPACEERDVVNGYICTRGWLHPGIHEDDEGHRW